MPKYSQNSVLSAIKDVQSGISLRKAAQRWRVPRSTLQNRLSGTVTRNEANEHNQRLSKQQEYHVAQWVLSQKALGFPPTRNQITEFVGRVIKVGGDDRPLGGGWIEGFLRRNPEVKRNKKKVADESQSELDQAVEPQLSNESQS